jgi:hypothetical protein
MNRISKRAKRKADQALSPGSNVENESKKRRKVKNESVKHRKVKNESVKRRNNKTESAKRQNDEEVVDVDDEEVPMYDVIRQRNIETRERLFNELKIGEAVSDLRTSMSTPKPLRVKRK